MLRKVLVVLGFVILGHLLLTQPVEARYDYELGYYCSRDSEYRDAADAEDWIERGRASVTDSPVFRDGIRLTAGAVEEEEQFEPGLASAIYRFTVPGWAHYLKISVCYNDASKDNKVAGRLWIKSTDKDVQREIESEEEVPFYGDTFVLRSDRTSETICVPSARHVEDGRLEMHIVAEGRDCLDVKYIRVEYLEKKPARIRVVHRICDDYWHMWPPFWYVYHYYYWGPYYWPRAHLVYEWWEWPCDYYWTVWRPWFRLHVRGHYFHPWWGPRRYTVVYHCHPDDPPARRRALLRRRLKERQVWAGKILRSPLVARNSIRAPWQIWGVRTPETRPKKQIRSKRLAGRPGFDPIQRQLVERLARVHKRPAKRVVKPHTSGRKYHESRRLLRSKSRSESPSTSQIRGENRKQIQSRTMPRMSRPKPVVRETSRIRSMRTLEARPKKQIWGRSEIRGKSWFRNHATKRTFSARSGTRAFGTARR